MAPIYILCILLKLLQICMHLPPASLHTGTVRLWRNFDVVLCLTAAGDFGNVAEVWAQVGCLPAHCI